MLRPDSVVEVVLNKRILLDPRFTPGVKLIRFAVELAHPGQRKGDVGMLVYRTGGPSCLGPETGKSQSDDSLLFPFFQKPCSIHLKRNVWC